MYNIALFDLDGTLTDSKEGIIKSVCYALSYFGIKVENPDTLAPFLGPPLRDSFQSFYNFSPEQAETAVKKYREYFTNTGIYENKLYAGIDELLSKLKVAEVTLAIATSKVAEYAERIAAHFNLTDYFDLIAGSELDGTRSRKSEVILYALDKLDPNRSLRTVMIGDRKHDIIGAKEMDIDSIGVLWGYGSRAEFKEAGAMMITENPEELGRLILEGGKK